MMIRKSGNFSFPPNFAPLPRGEKGFSDGTESKNVVQTREKGTLPVGGAASYAGE